MQCFHCKGKMSNGQFAQIGADIYCTKCAREVGYKQPVNNADAVMRQCISCKGLTDEVQNTASGVYCIHCARKFGYVSSLGTADAPSTTPSAAAPLAISLPPEVEQYRHEIRRFVEAMVYKLGVHASKGKWKDITIEQVLKKLGGEMAELEEAVRRGNMIEIMLESADVANYALIGSAIAMERGK